MRGNKAPETHRNSNFERRLKETMGTETDPEMYTPQTAEIEELPYDEIFPIVNNMNQTNMKPGGKRVRDGQLQSGRDNE